MAASDVGTSRPSRRLARECGALAAALAVAAMSLAACGGSSNPKSASKSASAQAPSGQAGASATTSSGTATSTGTASATSTGAGGRTSTSTGGGTSTAAAGGTSTVAGGGTSTAAGGGTSTSTKEKTPTTRTKNRAPTHTKNPTAAPSYANLPVVTTVTQSYLPPGYNGPSPTNCLQAAGLTRARQGREQGTWEANIGSSSETDSNSMVFLSGPYQDPTAAANYAQSLKEVELAASGGVWVASASVRSNLQTPVDNVANCMAQ